MLCGTFRMFLRENETEFLTCESAFYDIIKCLFQELPGKTSLQKCPCWHHQETKTHTIFHFSLLLPLFLSNQQA